MPNPYLPPKDADFALWLNNFAAVGAASPVVYALSAGEVLAINAADAAFTAALATATDPSTRTADAVAAKDTARANAEAVVRPIATRISRTASISNAAKVAIGVTVPSVSPTPIPAPVTAPSLIFASGVVGVANLQFCDSTTPNSRAKPVGTVGIEVWRAIGTTPAVSPEACDFAGIFTRTPMQLSTGPVAGKVVTLFARWVNRSGPGGQAATGPWSLPLVITSL